MATTTFNPTSITADRVPSAGYMTIGKNSSGTNRAAVVAFPALSGIVGTITAVRLCFTCDNTDAGEGFSTGAYHIVRQRISGFDGIYYSTKSIGGATGAVTDAEMFQIVLGTTYLFYSTTEAFEIKLQGHPDSADSTSKAYLQSSVHIEVDYNPIAIKVWTGTEHKTATGIKVWTGTEWETGTGVKVYDGATWQD